MKHLTLLIFIKRFGNSEIFQLTWRKEVIWRGFLKVRRNSLEVLNRQRKMSKFQATFPSMLSELDFQSFLIFQCETTEQNKNSKIIIPVYYISRFLHSPSNPNIRNFLYFHADLSIYSFCKSHLWGFEKQSSVKRLVFKF